MVWSCQCPLPPSLAFPLLPAKTRCPFPCQHKLELFRGLSRISGGCLPPPYLNLQEQEEREGNWGRGENQTKQYGEDWIPAHLKFKLHKAYLGNM